MNTLLKQAIIAHKAGLYLVWFSGLSDEQKKQFHDELTAATDGIRNAFGIVGERFVSFGEKIAKEIAEGFSLES